MSPPLQRDLIDGVETFSADSGRSTLDASLIFRCGMADETLITSGWLHLLEHLALHGPGSMRLDVNGSVGLVLTSFDLSGDPRDVSARLADITGRLLHIDPAVVEHESRVLREEGRQRSIGATAEAALWRYGARGPGLLAFDEPGLGRVTPQGLAELASRVFTTGNAVLCLSGPVPVGLRLHLPAGPRSAPFQAQPLNQSTPSVYQHRLDSIVVSGIVPREAASPAFAAILTDRVVNQLRHSTGLSYSPGSGYNRLTANEALVVAWADLRPENVPAAYPHLAASIQSLAQYGPTESEVTDYRLRSRRSFDDPITAAQDAWRCGVDHLLGKAPQPLEELIEQIEGLRAADVAAIAESFRTSMMTGVPSFQGLDLTGQTVLSGPGNPLLPGRGYSPRAGTDSWLGADSLLTVNGTYLQRRVAGQAVTVDLTNLAGVLHWRDGARTMIRPDGYTLHFEPRLWTRGAGLLKWLDANIPAELMLPQPDRAEAAIPSPRARIAGFLRAHLAWLVIVGFLLMWALYRYVLQTYRR